MPNTTEQEVTDRQDWIVGHWRPMMAVCYMIVVMFDFIVAPVFWSVLQVWGSGTVALQWNPLTLIGGGIFHAAMGAVLGISAFTRGKEKIERIRAEYEGGSSDVR